MSRIAGVILAGGQSSRMGKDKAELNRDGQTMLQFNQQLLVEAGFEQVFVSRNCGDGIKDVIANRGPLAGIYSVLKHVSDSQQYDSVLILAVDMPLLTADLLHVLCEQGSAEQRPVCYADNFFPLYLPVNQQVLDYLYQQISTPDGNLKVKGLIRSFDGDFIEHQHHPKLINTNTPEQWQQSQVQLVSRG